MSERDVPPTGPLARFRAQLAGPRGYRRIDELISMDDADAAIAALTPTEVFEIVHEVGFEDAIELIHRATPVQLQGCFDLDGWNKDQLEVASLKPWLSSLMDAGFEKFGEVWAYLDSELRALIAQRQITRVYDVSLGEEPEDENENAIMATPDRFFMLELAGDEENQRFTMQIIEDLYRADGDLARHTIMSARSEPAAELEEMSYRWRAGRLADLGYVDFYEALELFRPLEAAHVQIGEGTQDRADHANTSGKPSLAVVEEVLGRNFLARALAAIDAPADAEQLEQALVVLVNRVLAAGRAKPGQADVVRRGALYATATLSLGLETVARGDLARATEALRTVGLVRLFRVGYTVTHKLARLAQALAPRSLTAGSPAKELVAGLCTPRPLFSRAADLPPAPGVRPFEAAADLRRAGEILTGLTLRIALVEALGVDVLAMGQAPEPRPTLDDHVRTALARTIGGGPFSGEALGQRELAALRARMANGKLDRRAALSALDAVRARLGAAQLTASGPIIAQLVDGWLADLEGILGGVADAEIDPRFVEGVLVEVRRS